MNSRDLPKPEVETKDEEQKEETVGIEEEKGENEKVEEKSEVKLEEDLTWTQEKIMKQSRKFNIDLAPKVGLFVTINENPKFTTSKLQSELECIQVHTL